MDNQKNRASIIIVAIGLVFAIYSGQLFYIQVLSESFQGMANRNMVKTKIVAPPRGKIFDRQSRIYVSNRPMFNMLITPRELFIPDTTILESYLGLSRQEIRERIKEARAYSTHKESVFARYISPEVYGALVEETWNFGGISFRVTNKRFYNSPVGANLLGYIGEVNPQEIESSGGSLIMGDLIGKSGIERSHDSLLRGKPGIRKVIKDVHNREVGSYREGSEDIPAERGVDIVLSIDTDLQAFGEELMQNKKGSIVAIEPYTGDILAFVSAPSFDPSLLTGREMPENWRELRQDTLKPLYNRPLMAAYPPGSIFKIPQALAALNEGIIKPGTYYSCGGGFSRNRGKPGCRFHVTPLKLNQAIKYSCNSYFSATYMDFLHNPKYEDIYEAFDTWHQYMWSMGLGHRLGVDMPYEKPGLLPTAEMYDNEKRWYGHNRWNALTVISNAIGQGEVLITPVQMANVVAMIANRGWYYKPHFKKAYYDTGQEKWIKVQYQRKETGIERRHFETVIDAMNEVVNEGTGRRAIIKGVEVCGKTGTVENPHGEDHATFIAFAPRENPRIAILVIIENSGHGGTWAAPTAALMIEKYLKGEIESKQYELQRVRNADFIHQEQGR